MIRTSLVALAAASLLTACTTTDAPTSTQDEQPAMPMTDADRWLWLEEVEGERAMGFVEAANARSTDLLRAEPGYRAAYDAALEILDSDARIPFVGWRGDALYNVWQDAANPRGVLRRTTLSSYRSGEPDWTVVLDVDALAADEGEEWVYKGSTCLADASRCMVALSRGGKDATVLREFDLASGSFVAGGFELPESKGGVEWVDADTLLVARDAGAGTMTASGYPATVRRWQRGTPLDSAEELFRTDLDHLGAFAVGLEGPEGRVLGVYEGIAFHTRRMHLLIDGELRLLDVPDDADLESWFAGRVLVSLKAPWSVDGQAFGAGDLVAVDPRGEAPAELVLAPPASGAIAGTTRTSTRLLVTTLEHVQTKLHALHRKDDGTWVVDAIDLPGIGTARMVTADPHQPNAMLLFEDFLTPDTLFEVNPESGALDDLYSLPAFFDTDGMTVDQHFATSADGTQVPYFVVLPKGFTADGSSPALLGAYGGFESSRLPFYSATYGTLWLSDGGVYVSANIRGGGEYGPAWHRAALRDQRPRAYEDFEAVAEDLVRRGITSPERLGIMGGSNGGLLVGATMVRRPELYGAVVCQVPLLDMQRYHLLLAGASWVAEYGDPDNPDDWAFMQTWSPYQLVRADADYPPMLLRTSTRDDRVHPGHARKMYARMKEQGHDVLYWENTVGGHAGATTNAERAMATALEMSFLKRVLFGG